MDRWVSRSSSGRLTSARSRCSWSATWTCSSASRGSSSRTASTSTASSVTSFSGGRRCLPAPLGRSTTSSVNWRAWIRTEAALHPRSSARSRRGAPLRGSSSRASRTSAATAGFADTLLHTIAEVESALAEPDSLARELFELVVAYRSELAALGLQDRDGMRRRAVERLRERSRCMVGRARLRVRLRGSDRRRVGAARGALGANGCHRLDPVRARARRVRGARADGRGSRAARRWEDPGAAAPGCARTPSPCGARPPGALAFLRRASSCPAARWSDPLPRGRRDSRERWSSSRARLPLCCEAGSRRSASRSSATRPTAGARRSERRCRSSTCRSPSSTAAASGTPRSAERCSRCSGTRGSAAGAATCSRSCARRSRGSSVDRSTSWRGGSAGARSPNPDRVDEESERLRGAHIPALVALRAADDPVAAVRDLVGVDGAKRVGRRVSARR